MIMWFYGFTVLRLCGFTVLRLCGFMVLRFYGFAVVRFYGCAVIEYSNYPKRLISQTTNLLFCGNQGRFPNVFCKVTTFL